MQNFWAVLLAFLLAGYFVLGGYDYGVQMLHPVIHHTRSGYNSVLGAVGPFFLGNEVWLIAFAGVLFAGFPFLEGVLLSGMYPLVVMIVLGVAIGKSSVQLRWRSSSIGALRIWNQLLVIGGAFPAIGWGMMIGLLLRGVRLGAGESFSLDVGQLLNPFVLLCGLSGLLLFAGHGAVFLALRARGEVALLARVLARPLLLATAGVIGVAAAVGWLTDATASLPDPGAALVAAVALMVFLLVAVVVVELEQPAIAFAVSSLAAAYPVLLLAVALHPTLLLSSVDAAYSLTVDRAVADSATLRLLTPMAVIMVPTILAYQIWNWRIFSGRVDERAPSYF